MKSRLIKAGIIVLENLFKDQKDIDSSGTNLKIWFRNITLSIPLIENNIDFFRFLKIIICSNDR